MGMTAEEALGASMTYTNKKVSESAGLHREIVTSLPATGDENTIYMVLDQTASSPDIYDEWLWVNGAYEHIGSTRVDLTNYYNKTQVDTALSGKANVATSLSGYGITDAYTKSEVDTALNGKADTSAIPTALSQLSADATHRVVTDTEKSTWNGKANSATSLSGYGITDAYTKSEVDTKLRGKVSTGSVLLSFTVTVGNITVPTGSSVITLTIPRAAQFDGLAHNILFFAKGVPNVYFQWTPDNVTTYLNVKGTWKVSANNMSGSSKTVYLQAVILWFE